jgi:PqqD family protein of HPr-rel-A system
VAGDAHETLWEVPDAAGIVWRQWGDEVAVYAESTGGTHLLDADGGAVLLSLLQLARPAYTDEVVAMLGDAAVPSDAPAQTAAVLDALRKIGLVAPRAT